MCYIRGSHRWKRADSGEPLVYQMSNLITDKTDGAQPVKEAYQARTGLPPLPDIEHNEGDYDIVYIGANPGDVIVHHNQTVHGSFGNSSGRHRRGASIRYVGDDVVYGYQARSLWAGPSYSSPTKESPLAKRVANGEGPGNPGLALNNRSKKAGSSSSSSSSTSTSSSSSANRRAPNMGSGLKEGEPLPSIPAFPVVWPKGDVPPFAKL